MSFDHPLALLLVLLPIAWAAWEWRSSGRRLALLLKAGAFAAIALALASPRLTVYESKVAVAMLADTSASISSGDLQTESAFAEKLERARGRHWTRIIPFARATRVASADERVKSTWQLRHTAGTAGHGTNLESAIRDGAAALPAGMVPRLLLVSDGNENLGSVSRAIWQAQQLGVPIDTMALAGRPKPGLVLESIALPGQVFSGERFPIEVTLQSPRAAKATVEMTAEGKSIGSNHVDLVAGANHFRLQANVNSVGAIALAGKIVARRSRRGAVRGRRDAAEPPRAAAFARSGRERTAPDSSAPGEPVRSGARDQRNPRQARQLSARGHQQLGHGEHSRPAQGGARGLRESRAAGWCGSPASTTFTSTRKGAKRTRWSDRSRPNWRRRGRPKARPWC